MRRVGFMHCKRVRVVHVAWTNSSVPDWKVMPGFELTQAIVSSVPECGAIMKNSLKLAQEVQRCVWLCQVS